MSPARATALIGVGVLAQLRDPDLDELVEVAQNAEQAGAAWLGISDTFWGWDSWITLGELARATVKLEIGPVVTNPYLRHGFQTASAVATLQRLAGPRVFVGLGAGGSELKAAGVDRSDAPQRVEQLARVLRRVAAGGPFDAEGTQHLEVPLNKVPILVAGRGPRMLQAAGHVADRALLWGFPTSELAWGVSTIKAAAEQAGRAPRIVWAPLVDDSDGPVPIPGGRSGALSVAAYAVLNSQTKTRRAWGLAGSDTAKLRARILADGPAAASNLLPAAALDDLLLRDTDPQRVASSARRFGVDAIAVPVFDTKAVNQRVTWALSVAEHLGSGALSP